MNPVVLIIADEPDQLALLTAQLERGRRFASKGFTRPEEALDEIRTNPPDAVVCDLVRPGLDVAAFTRRLREMHPALPLIVVAARDADTEAEPALRVGATDFVTRPVDARGLETRLRRALEQVPAQELLTSVTAIRFDRHGLVGQHPLLQRVRQFVDQVARAAQVSALLLGESGTGKNMVARAIHGASAQASRRFVEINCTMLSPELLEAELFGWEAGARTEVPGAKKGLVEVADGGTLYLDEIGYIPAELQLKLLAFLESRTFRRQGAEAEQPVALRVVASSNRDLAAEVAAGRFNRELFQLLGVAAQLLPPLRAIRSDIPELARHFVKRAAGYFARPVPHIEQAGLERLQRHDWPGNARELRNVVERAMISGGGRTLTALDVDPGPASLSGTGVTLPRGLTLEEVERLYIEAALRDQGGSVEATARQLGISRKVLWQRRRRHGLGRPRGERD